MKTLQCKEQIVTRVSKENFSCTSMVVTLFGDTVSQHGGWIWLGSLIQALAPFGYDERLVRTAVNRLARSDWLKVNRVGRRSFYCFTDTARRHYEKAARRIYAAERPDWDGNWTLVVPSLLDEDKKEVFRKSLLWMGFNTLVNGLYAHPSSDRTSLDETIYEQGLSGDVVVLTARTDDMGSRTVIKELVRNRWKLSELETAYRDLLEFYGPVCRKIIKKLPDPQESFMLRSILIHDYRRILLRDPDFPDAMLPQGWAGREAYLLIKRTYKSLVGPSLKYIQQNLENSQGTLQEPVPLYSGRFGGLET